jgi:hypothetical protein
LHCDEGWTVCLVEQVDVLDDSSEGLPVSLVKHGFVDGRKASMIILGHLVDVNGSVGWSDEACFRFALFFVRTRKKECNQRSGGQCLPICLF